MSFSNRTLCKCTMTFACVGRLLLSAVFLTCFTKLGNCELSQKKNDTFKLNTKQLLLAKQVGYSLMNEYRSILFKQDLSALVKKVPNISMSCIKNMNATMKDRAKLMKYIDAAGKPNSGLYRGNLFWIGSFAECEDISDANYCLSSLGFGIPSINFDVAKGITWGACFPKGCNSTDISVMMQYIFRLVEKEIPELKVHYSGTLCPEKATYTEGVKVTLAVCGVLLFLCLIGTLIDWAKEAFSGSTTQITVGPYHNLSYQNEVVVATAPSNAYENLHGPSVATSSKTHEDLDVPENGDDQLTSDDVHLLAKPSLCAQSLYVSSKLAGVFSEIFLCFSLLRNTKKIFNTNVPPIAITSINGIRVISISWVILGHTLIIFATNPLTENKLELTSDAARLSAMPIINGFYSVDSFFFLSGLLVAYTCFRKLRKSGGNFNWFMFYIHRFWRLTPSYMFVILFSVELNRFLSDGPLWYSEFDNKLCQKYWWTNLLYINNFHPKDLGDECIGWSWYLANDMQFFVITPLLLYPIFKYGRRALVIPITLLSACSVIIAVIIGYYDLDPNSSSKIFDQSPESKRKQTEYGRYVYIKPYCRIQPYLVGFLMGYFIYKNYTTTKRPSWIVTLVGWTVAIVVGMLLVYGIHDSIQPGAKEWNTAENVAYGTSQRFLWGLVLAWVTYACHYGAGGLVQKFLSARFWIPLSRLTYSVYLIHLVVLPVLFIGAKGLIYYDLFTVSYYFIVTVVLSYAAGFILAVAIEFPCDNLEQLALKAFGKARRSLHA